MDDKNRRETGMKMRRAVLGAAHVDRAQGKLSDFNGDFQDLRMVEVLMSGLPFALAKAAGAGGID